VLAGRRLTTLDLDETVERTRDWREKIHAGRRA
jgi:hypothetical protein